MNLREFRRTRLTKAERIFAAERNLKMAKSKWDLGYLNSRLVYEEVQRATSILTTDRIAEIFGMPYWEILEKFGDDERRN